MRLSILLVALLCGLYQHAYAATFSFKEPSVKQSALMLANFGEACFVWMPQNIYPFSHGHYEPSAELSDCFSDTVGQTYVDGATRELADKCSTLNVLIRITKREDEGDTYSFKKLSWNLDGESIASAREACGQLVHAFAAMPFDQYGKAIKACEKLLRGLDECISLERTEYGIIVGFFFFEPANDVISQCETIKANQPQPPPNMFCTLPWKRFPDLRFKPSLSLAECPPLETPAVPPSCESTNR